MRVLKRITLAVLLFVLPALAWAQGSVVLQSGGITPGHASKWVANGVIGDGGAALGGPVGTNITELGVTNTGTPWCVTDVPITSPYHQLCFGANTLLGYGVLSYNAYGGAAELPFVCIINGVVINPCFGSGSGTITKISITANPCVIATPNPITTIGTISTNIPFSVPCGGTGNTSFTALGPILGNDTSPLVQGTRTGNTTTFATSTGTLTANDCAMWDSSGNVIDAGAPCGSGGGGGGTVTSVGLATPVEFVVSGSPVTTAGTLTFTKATELANTVWAGPTSGGAAVPTFRALTTTDLPSLPCSSTLAGLVPATGGGTSTFLRADCTFATPAGAGTVTSVAQTVPVEFTISGSPITGAGTLAIGKATETANTVWAGPASGGDAQPTFRALTAADIPSLPCSALPTGGCPFDIAMTWNGIPSSYVNCTTPTDSCVNVAITRNVGCPTAFLGSIGIAQVASTGTAVYNINQVTAGVATNRGTLTFASSATGVFASTFGMLLVTGDIVQFAAPTTADATLADIAITLKCARI